MSGPIQEFESLLSSSEFLFLVYYRGHWCPFCVSYTKTLQALKDDITAAGGKIAMVTAEVPEHLGAFRSTTGYTETTIVDPENILAAELKKRGLIDIAISERSGYEHGLAQPGVLVVKKDGTVLFKWAIVPSLMNLGGAKDRPDLHQIWDNVDAQLHNKPIVHKNFKTLSATGVLKEKIFG